MEKKHRTIPIFVPHMGCPNNCSFCNQRKITGMGTAVTPSDVASTIEKHLETIDARSTEVEIGFFGGSFTAIPTEQQTALLKAAYPYVESGKVIGIRLSTRPDCIDEDILTNLKRYAVSAVELGVQSMDNEVLKKNLRGHTAEDAEQASEMIHSFGFSLGHQVMLGLPGDTEKKTLESVRRLIRLKPEDARIYPTLVIRGTLLDEWYREGSYRPLELAAAVELSKEVLKLFRSAGTNVIRIGLLGSDNINQDNDVAAGPFHPAFGELVQSALVYEALCGELKNVQGDRVQIEVHPRFVSTLVGCRRKNVRMLQNQFSFQKITVLQNEQMKIGEWRIT